MRRRKNQLVAVLAILEAIEKYFLGVGTGCRIECSEVKAKLNVMLGISWQPNQRSSGAVKVTVIGYLGGKREQKSASHSAWARRCSTRRWVMVHPDTRHSIQHWMICFSFNFGCYAYPPDSLDDGASDADGTPFPVSTT